MSLGGGLVLYELWNNDGEGPNEEQRAKQEGEARLLAEVAAIEAAASASVAATAAAAAAGGGEEVACPWPECTFKSKNERVRPSREKEKTVQQYESPNPPP